MTLSEIFHGLYDHGRCPVDYDEFSTDETHDVLRVLASDGTPHVINVSVEKEQNTLYIERFFSAKASPTPQTMPLLYIALATANTQLLDGGHGGACHLFPYADTVHFVYSLAVPLFSAKADMAVAFIDKALSAISLVEPYFSFLVQKMEINDLSVDDVFSFQSISVNVHPAVKLYPEAKAAFKDWLASSKVNETLLHAFKSGPLGIYHVVTDSEIGIYVSDGCMHIKIDEFAPSLVKNRREFLQRVGQSWHVYHGLAAYLRLPPKSKYPSFDCFALEIGSTFW